MRRLTVTRACACACVLTCGQLVIEVPTSEAYPLQDARIEPASLTCQPCHHSSLHGEWLPRINVPVRTDRPRPSLSEAGPPSPKRRSPSPPRLHRIASAVTYQDGAPSPTQVGNPFGNSVRSSQESSRASLASERRLRESARRTSMCRLLTDPPSPDGSQPAAPSPSSTPASLRRNSTATTLTTGAAATGSSMVGDTQGGESTQPPKPRESKGLTGTLGQLLKKRAGVFQAPPKVVESEEGRAGESQRGSGKAQEVSSSKEPSPPPKATPPSASVWKQACAKVMNGQSASSTSAGARAPNGKHRSKPNSAPKLSDTAPLAPLGCTSSRSVSPQRSRNVGMSWGGGSGGSGGPANRKIFPRDIAVEQDREEEREAVRNEIRKEKEKEREKVRREEERVRRFSVSRRGTLRRESGAGLAS